MDSCTEDVTLQHTEEVRCVEWHYRLVSHQWCRVLLYGVHSAIHSLSKNECAGVVACVACVV